MKVYLDNAATTPIHPEVIESMQQSMKSTFGNPSSTHSFGRKAKTLLETARKNIANHFNVSSGEIIFTAGGSEADNLILRNAVTNLGVKRIITAAIEHHAVLYTIESFQNEFDIEVAYVKLQSDASIDLTHLESLLQESHVKTLVSLMFVNNEMGKLLNMVKVCKLCKTNDALFHSDTVQGVGRFKINLQQTPVDFITASAHKFHGPKGVGFAFVKKEFGIKPLLIGGEQERGARAGTENIHSILGMEKALQIACDEMANDRKYIQGLKDYFVSELKVKFPNIAFNASSHIKENTSYVILNVRFPVEIPMLLFQMDLKGVAASGGSACQSGSQKGSHVLQAILSESQAQKTSVRFSFSKFNTQKELEYAISVLEELITME